MAEDCIWLSKDVLINHTQVLKTRDLSHCCCTHEKIKNWVCNVWNFGSVQRKVNSVVICCSPLCILSQTSEIFTPRTLHNLVGDSAIYPPQIVVKLGVAIRCLTKEKLNSVNNFRSFLLSAKGFSSSVNTSVQNSAKIHSKVFFYYDNKLVNL